MSPRLDELTTAAPTWKKQAKDALLEWSRALALAGDIFKALPIFESRLGVDSPHLAGFKKAIVDAHSGTTVGALAFAPLSRGWLASFEERRLLPQLAGTLPISVNAKVPLVTMGATADFVAEGAPAPVARADIDLVEASWSKIALILALTREWLRGDDLALFDRHLQNAVIDGEDPALLGTAAAVQYERPAGLLYGISPVGTGGSPGSIGDDLVTLWASVRSGSPQRPAFITSPTGAVYLGSLDPPAFANVSVLGNGSILGVPLLVSKAAGSKLILVDAGVLGVSDNGMIVEASNYSAIQMDTDPAAGAQNLVSAFQTNTTFIRITRYVHWVLGADDGVGYIELPIAA